MNGSWQIESSDSVADFYSALGVPDGPGMERMRKMNNKGAEGPTEVILIDGDTLAMRILRPDGVEVMGNKFQMDQQIDMKSLDGRDIKVKISRDGDAFIRDETDGNYTCKWTRTVAGDTMTVVMESGANKCTRVYKRV